MSPVNVSSIGSYIREQREQAKISLRQLAQAAGVSNPYLSRVERGLRRPSADILQQIAKGLRISAEALYVQAGILDEERGNSSVTDAIMADSGLTERQKQMLIDIYDSFRREVRADADADALTGPVADDEDDVVYEVDADGSVVGTTRVGTGAPASGGAADEDGGSADENDADAWARAAALAAEADGPWGDGPTG